MRKIRKKLLEGSNLSDYELLTVVIGEPKVAESLLNTYGTLGEIYQSSPEELAKQGLKKSQIATFKAYQEISKRILSEKAKRGEKLLGPEDVFKLFEEYFLQKKGEML